jgi:type IV secretion system protein VirB10
VSEAATIDNGLPIVGEERGNRGLWIGLGAIAAGGILLFALLEAGRGSDAEPAIASPNDYVIASTLQPGLVIPDGLAQERSAQPNPLVVDQALIDGAPKAPPVRLKISPSPDPELFTPPAAQPSYAEPVPPVPAEAPSPGRGAPVIVYDAAQAAVTAAVVAPGQNQAMKARAVGGGDRTDLVQQGTLIFAVLETALDSTQAGQVRAMISTDVYNALGDRILIQKGSRIFGEYKSDLGSGQNRAQIIWTRLLRPDGASIALDSPASDQLGRAGIKGKVNSHFGERLLSSLLR